MSADRQDTPLPSPRHTDPMSTDNDSTPTGTSVPPRSHTNSPRPTDMSRTGSEADSLRPLSRVRRPRQSTASEAFKDQLSYAFRYLYKTLQERQDEF